VTLFAADTETFLISPGVQAPPLVSLQFAIDDHDPQIIHARDPACRRTIEWALSSATWSFHNLAFDAAVICAAYPDLTEQVFAAYDDDRMTCTIARQKLLDIASGRFKVVSRNPGYALDAVARRLHVDLELNKADDWRLKYGTLYKVDLKDWPADARAYALLDARAQREVHRGQDAYSANKGYPLTDQFRQSRKSWWVHLMSCRGMRVDGSRIDQYIADVRESLLDDRETCLDHGLVLWDGKKFVKKQKPAQEHMVRICQETEEPDLPITETGEEVLREELGLKKDQQIPIGATWQLWEKHQKYVKLDEDSCQLFGDEVLEAYQRYGTSTTQIARAERLRLASSRGLPIQSRFQALGADTGRTTCSQGDGKKGAQAKAPSALGFQLQNPAKDKKVKRKDGTTVMRKGTRELFIPRDGYYFCSTDYGSMELCGWAFVCLKKVGRSKLAEVLNQKRDPHTELAATLARITVEEAYARANNEDHPLHKEFKSKFRQAAKVANFGFPGGMGWKKMVLAARKQYGVILTPEGSKALRDAWLATWPEAPLYFQYINRELELNGKGDKKARTVAIEQMGSGRVRGGCWYTQAANTLFQGLCADIAGEAMHIASREMYADRTSPLYGSRLVNFLHDEGFCEVPIERAHEAAHRIAQIQIDVGTRWAPDVLWSCKPALMRRWYKDAGDVHDATGRLIPWEPEVPAEKKVAA
jgi:DNA polymerase-1